MNPALASLRGSVELVDNLYTTMIDTLPLSEKLGQSLDSLKLPLAELALTDPGFFQNRVFHLVIGPSVYFIAGFFTT